MCKDTAAIKTELLWLTNQTESNLYPETTFFDGLLHCQIPAVGFCKTFNIFGTVESAHESEM